MTRTVTMVRLDELEGAPVNPKDHAGRKIEESIDQLGLIDLITMDERTESIISGHGRRDSLRAMHARNDAPPDDVDVDVDGMWLVPVVRGWSSIDDAHRDAALITLNSLVPAGGWRNDELVDMLQSLTGDPVLLSVTNYTEDDIESLFASLTDDPLNLDPANPPSNGGVLDAVGVTIAEPRTTVHNNQVWTVGPHVLAVVDVIRGWPLFARLLAERDGAWFIPYPGPFCALSKANLERPFVMVTPDHYTAGHVLDRFEEVRKLTPELAETWEG